MRLPRPKRAPLVPRYHQTTGRRWRKLRAIVLRDAHGQCADCGRGAEEVHHQIPISKGGDSHDVANLVPLCRLCHDARHGGRQRHA